MLKQKLSLLSISVFMAVFLALSCTNSEPIPTPTIGAINCSSASSSETPLVNNPYNGIVTVPYSGGNAAAYSAGTAISSTGVTGLTATLEAGTLSSSGSLSYIITGTPSAAGTASFAISFGGQSCTLNLAVVVPTPTVTGFTPTSGAVGTAVTITGTNFSTLLANNIVKFNGVAATVTASTSTSITTTVPTGATTGKVTVMVGTNTGTSSSNFTVTTASTTTPTIKSFTPGSGAVGTAVTITGTNFSTTAANNIVKFNGTTAQVTASTATTITTSVPTGATTGAITVTVGTASASSSTNFTVTTASTTTAFTNATIKPMFDTYCASCHASGKSNQKDWLYNPADYTVSIKGYITKLYSEVYTKKTMPEGTKLSTAELTAFKAWYDAGYPAN